MLKGLNGEDSLRKTLDVSAGESLEDKLESLKNKSVQEAIVALESKKRRGNKVTAYDVECALYLAHTDYKAPPRPETPSGLRSVLEKASLISERLW